MSTAITGAAQRDRLTQAGLTVTALPRLTDVDTIADARRVALSCPGSRFASALARIDQPTALNVYDDALRTGRPLRLVARDGLLLPFALDRWAAPADHTDHAMLDRCGGATLDVGCGPGRLTAALARRGHQVLGVDIAAAAVERTTSRGARAVRGSVFDRLPDEGCWDTVLLADGNVGIGGDPPALLARLRELVRPGGLLVIETEQIDVDEVGSYELQAADGSVVSAPFRWARVGPLALQRQAAAASLVVDEVWTSAGRRFTSLRA